MATVRKKKHASSTGAPDTLLLLDRVVGVPAFSKRLEKARANDSGAPVYLDHAEPASWPFLCALVARGIPAPGRLWITVPDMKMQERIHAELETWGVKATFFPERESDAFIEAIPDPENEAERLSVLHEVSLPGGRGASVVVLLESSLDDDVPRAETLHEREQEIRKGQILDPGELVADLEAAGYERTIQVVERGQFALRGGIFDVFSWQAPTPVRIEFFGDEVDSLRSFDVDSQTSITKRDHCTLLFGREGGKGHFQKVSGYIAPDDTVVGLGMPGHLCHIVITGGTAPGGGEEDFSTACLESPIGGFEAGDFILQESKREGFHQQLEEWAEDGWQVAMFFNNEGEIQRFQELVTFGDATPAPENFTGRLSRGFSVPSAKLAVLCDAEVFGRYQHLRARRQFHRERQRASVQDFREFKMDDIVVHSEYGIAIYRGLDARPLDDGEAEDVIVLEYADKAKLYVPLQQAHLVSRYIGAGGKTSPPLGKLGDGRWSTTRQKAERSILDYAAQLLAVQAERQTVTGYTHPPDTEWQFEFENSFLFKETPDQRQAIEETKHDMEGERPMDRLICGDVGFGKTEVAIRAAFKSVMGGRQVAILVPTTVLAQQHYTTLRERMSDYPVKIELLSRLRTTAQQKKVIGGLANGSVDIVVGTHRLISKDIVFKKLGLAVIDEEQRFGVKHKERFKELFCLVDVLTLSATPIPRTLYLSLMGAKDMSTIDTPPPNRVPVKTTICAYDEQVIRTSINHEVKRGGQVFFLHNRVGNIGSVAKKIRTLCPGVRVGIGHGQMEPHDLEEVMHTFLKGETQVLLCTTIIESGIDIPNANTIIIDRADRFGLADLYQLRGRVGRAGQKAYAYLLLPPDSITVGDARKRINAIKQYSSLGSGFRIAMRDLEIRGAGNLLGLQQSGHIADRLRPLLQAPQTVRGQTPGQRNRPAYRRRLPRRFPLHQRVGLPRSPHRRNPRIHPHILYAPGTPTGQRLPYARGSRQPG